MVFNISIWDIWVGVIPKLTPSFLKFSWKAVFSFLKNGDEASGCCCCWHVTAGCPSWPNEVVDCSQGRLRLLRHDAVSSWLVDGNGIMWKYIGMEIYIYVYQYISIYKYIYISVCIYIYLYIYIYLGNIYIYWLVVWNMNFMTSIYWECHHPNWRSHISPHLCLGFLFLVVHFRPARPPPASRPPLTTCPHTTCSHTTCPHTQLVTHTTCPHTTCHHTTYPHKGWFVWGKSGGTCWRNLLPEPVWLTLYNFAGQFSQYDNWFPFSWFPFGIFSSNEFRMMRV